MLGSIPRRRALEDSTKFDIIVLIPRTVNLIDWITMRKIQSILVLANNKFDVTSIKYIAGLLVLLTVLLITFGSPLLYWAEFEAIGSNIKTLADAFWLNIMAITTIGFGDHYPITTLGRIIVGVVAFIGATLYCTLVGYIGGLVIAHTDKSTQNEYLAKQNAHIEELSAENARLNAEAVKNSRENKSLNKQILRKLK
jgi:voltage-gated potassium channel